MTSTDTPVAWTELGLSPEMLELIGKAGYSLPSPVQAQSIPHILTGHDVLVSSQTGSGKTASFVLPVVEKFKNKDGTYILALSPTREIAQQTGAVFEAFGAPFGLKTVVCIGGASLPVEKEALASSPHIIVATPGRMCDHLERGNVWLDFIQCLIFDEADRMLDMGFATQIQKITEQIPKERQTLMFSATFAPTVEKLARQVMKDPKMVTIDKSEGSVPKIDERLFWMREDQKLGELHRIIKEDPGTIIVFVNSKESVFRLWRGLADRGFSDATYIHSDITQAQREAAVADFKAGKFRVLIATDVMGRGIDVDDVAHVVNYDIPREAEDYVHRIGRTGRRGKTGMATSFAIPVRDEQNIRAIEKMKGLESPPLEPAKPKHSQHPKAGPKPGPKRKFTNKPMPAKPRPPQSQHQKPANSPKQQQTTMPPEPKAEVITPNAQKGGIMGWMKSLFKK